MELAAFAMKSEETEGRRIPEPAHPYRSEFQRDRDRVIHTKAFRRLENKTQVFAPDYSDHFRNRLTHTLEVAQISRTCSQALRLNTDLCEVLALSHDIGHPPFSHEGEKVLNELMRKCGSGFEHNLHALRIVEDFEERYPAFRGLNLTFEVREGIIKHSRDYHSNREAYLDISQYRLCQRPPLEAQIIDLADEIAYNSADLDDGYDSGLLELAKMSAESGLFSRLHRKVRGDYPAAPEKLRVSETIRRIINWLVTDLVRSTHDNLKRNDVRSVEEVRSFPARLVGFGDETRELNLQLKQFLRNHLYDHALLRTAREEVGCQIRDLFSFYVQNPDRLPVGHFSRVESLGPERVVCDYVAGMTDKFARAKHAEISTTFRFV